MERDATIARISPSTRSSATKVSARKFCSAVVGMGIIAGKPYKKSSVWSLAFAFVDIALHRRGPDELPASWFLLSLLLALYLSVSLVALWVLGALDSLSAVLLLLDSAFFLAYVFMALRLFQRDRRFQQTASALLGTDVVLNLVGLPLALWARGISIPVDPASAPMLLRLLLLLWWIDVASFILSRAIVRPYLVGVLFVILYVVASLSIGDFLSPATT
jgi:hypothetical protein